MSRSGGWMVIAARLSYRDWFTVLGRDMVLLHAFAKKTQKTPENALELARKRKRACEEAENEQT
ncbi:MAG: type II toxin-antitoxin system RelE/ParE family toxin [Magnetococcus sp. XQGC-1]